MQLVIALSSEDGLVSVSELSEGKLGLKEQIRQSSSCKQRKKSTHR